MHVCVCMQVYRWCMYVCVGRCVGRCVGMCVSMSDVVSL